MKLLPDKSIVALTNPYYHASQPTPYTGSGRPGVDLRFRIDNGQSWSPATQLIPVPPSGRKSIYVREVRVTRSKPRSK